MQRRYHDVMCDLVDAVVDGTYPEASWLPSEEALATRFGCGRGTAREALRGLEERGLVEVLRARGQRVCDRDEWDLRDPFVLRASIRRGPDAATLAHAIDARAAVDAAAATRAIRHASEADLQWLAGFVAEMEAAGDEAAVRALDASDPFVLADAWFHHALGALSGNTVLARLADPLHAVLALHRHVHAPERERPAIRHHHRILEGLAAREPALVVDAIEAYARALAQWLRGAEQ